MWLQESPHYQPSTPMLHSSSSPWGFVSFQLQWWFTVMFCVPVSAAHLLRLHERFELLDKDSRGHLRWGSACVKSHLMTHTWTSGTCSPSSGRHTSRPSGFLQVLHQSVWILCERWVQDIFYFRTKTSICCECFYWTKKLFKFWTRFVSKVL